MEYVVISKVSPSVLTLAFEAADSAATSRGRSRGGWVRLAKVRGTASEPYIVAARAVGTRRQIQFSCSCPDYRFRRAALAGGCCKHMSQLLMPREQPQRMWMFRAGKAFAEAVCAGVLAEAKKGRVAVRLRRRSA